MTIRLGLLSAANITTKAVVDPVAEVDGIELAAVGARDLDRARAVADKWEVPTAYGSYAELLADPAIDAIYVATPASHHRPWAVAALDAGKHLLVEKPLAANADDARRVAAAAAAHPELVAMEAFHWRYHPTVAYYQNLVAGGRIGTVERVEADFNLPEGYIPRDDIRWDFDIGGGATMDLGCYSIQWVRSIAGGRPEVVSANARTPVDRVDGRLDAELRWASGVTGRVTSSMVEPGGERVARLRVIGTDGELMVSNALVPHLGCSFEITTDGVTDTLDGAAVPGGELATYTHQLIAFRDAIEHGTPFPSTISDGVTNMEIIDDCYRAAGLPLRPAVPT